MIVCTKTFVSWSIDVNAVGFCIPALPGRQGQIVGCLQSSLALKGQHTGQDKAFNKHPMLVIGSHFSERDQFQKKKYRAHCC